MSTDLSASLLQNLKACRTLPSVPAVVVQVLDLCQDPDIGTARLAKAISRDPALVAKILRVANSAWCGVRREVTTLDQAVNLLGLNGAMSLALSFSLVRGLQQSGGAFDHQMYWRRSVIAATATRSVGAFIKAADHDELFLAGLLQDIGMLVLNQAVPAYGSLAASADGSHTVLVDLERAQFQADHAQVGAWFLKKWGLPDRLIAAVSGSHEPGGVGDTLTKSVALGSRIADIWIHSDTATATASVAETAKAILDLSSNQVGRILAMTAVALPEVTQNLDITVGDEAFISGLLDRAREALAEFNLRALQEARDFAVQAQRDALTSLYNRAYLNQVLDEHFEFSRNAGVPFTLVFLDIDKFKSINDTYGHQGGDAVLLSVSRSLRASTRDQDIIARFGGDEFVVLLAGADVSIGARIAERIRSTIERQPLKTDDGRCIQVTVSIGWATMSSNSSYRASAEVLETADRSLYVAKTAGRNRVVQAFH